MWLVVVLVRIKSSWPTLTDLHEIKKEIESLLGVKTGYAKRGRPLNSADLN
jgi:hypothetical protein